jgi:hypothetical protein
LAIGDWRCRSRVVHGVQILGWKTQIASLFSIELPRPGTYDAGCANTTWS